MLAEGPLGPEASIEVYEAKLSLGASISDPSEMLAEGPPGPEASIEAYEAQSRCKHIRLVRDAC
jgi:hypothetical protein